MVARKTILSDGKRGRVRGREREDVTEKTVSSKFYAHKFKTGLFFKEKSSFSFVVLHDQRGHTTKRKIVQICPVVNEQLV